jgi:hypothetical protein
MSGQPASEGVGGSVGADLALTEEEQTVLSDLIEYGFASQATLARGIRAKHASLLALVGQLQGQLDRVRVTRDWLRERAEYAGNIPTGFGAAADALDESLGAPAPWSHAWGVPHDGNPRCCCSV